MEEGTWQGRGLLAAPTHPSGNSIFPWPVLLPVLSSQPSIQGPGLSVCGYGNGQSSANPVRPGKGVALCVPSPLHACVVLTPRVLVELKVVPPSFLSLLWTQGPFLSFLL